MQKYLLLLLTLVASINALQFQLPIQKERMNLVKFTKFLNKTRSVNFMKRGVKFLDTEFPNDYFVTQISLGTPPQNFTVEVSTDFGGLAVLSKNYTNATKFEHKYDPDLSSTSSFNSSTFFDNYPSGILEGSVYADVFTFGNFSYDNQLFGSISKIDGDEGKYPVDGTFGLNWATNFTEELEPFMDPPINHIGEQLDKKIFTIFVSQYKDEKIKTGVITFGAFDTENCGPFNLFPLRENPFVERSFKVDSFSVDKYSINYDGKDRSIYSTEHPTIIVPTEEYSKILRYIEADFDFTYNLYVIPCDQISQKPDLIWQLGETGQNYSVPASSYIVDIGLSQGKCALAVTMYETWLTTKAYLLGDPFVQNYCAAYDFGNNQFGLGKVIKQ